MTGEIIYDDSAAVVEDLSGASGPVYRQFGAIKSFEMSFANLLGFKIGETAAEEGLKSGRQITIQDFDGFDGVFFQTEDFDFGSVFDTTLWLNVPDATGPGISQLTLEFLDTNLLPGSQLTFSSASELGVLFNVFNITTASLERVEEVMPAPVPLPAGLPLVLTATAILGWIGRGKNLKS